ncbi:MAG: hypothetical protein QXD48_01590 [Candidatus Aenigmatarchaeota archaeon]
MNRHIKVINGRKYYYESIRKGKKVISRYIGPVERLRKPRKVKEIVDDLEIETTSSEESYIG